MHHRLLIYLFLTIASTLFAEIDETEPTQSSPVSINHTSKQRGCRTAKIAIETYDELGLSCTARKELTVCGNVVLQGTPTKATEENASPEPNLFYTVHAIDAKAEIVELGKMVADPPFCLNTKQSSRSTSFWDDYPLLWAMSQEIGVTITKEGDLNRIKIEHKIPFLSAEQKQLIAIAQESLMRTAELLFLNLDVMIIKEHSESIKFTYTPFPGYPKISCALEVKDASPEKNQVVAQFSGMKEGVSAQGEITWDKRAGLACEIHETITATNYQLTKNQKLLPATGVVTLHVTTSGPRY